MAEFSNISWTDGTFNPWIGCTRVSPGCNNCYAENLMDRRYHKVKWGPGNQRSRTKTWGMPVKMNKWAIEGTCRFCHGSGNLTDRLRDAAGNWENFTVKCNACVGGKVEPYRVKMFTASLADWLDEEVPAQWREDLTDLIEACTSIDWLLLTKRIQNYEAMAPLHWLNNPLKNVWLGVTAEDQKYFDIRVPILEKIPAALRWVSYEPALGPINLPVACDIDWVIIGGESAQTMGARRFDIEWAERMIAQCRRRGIVPFMKQKGSNAFVDGHLLACKDKAGADPVEWPSTVCVQEFPVSPALV